MKLTIVKQISALFLACFHFPFHPSTLLSLPEGSQVGQLNFIGIAQSKNKNSVQQYNIPCYHTLDSNTEKTS